MAVLTEMADFPLKAQKNTKQLATDNELYSTFLLLCSIVPEDGTLPWSNVVDTEW